MRYKKIYFVGVKGVGMAALAILAKQAGFTVAGSDVPQEFITDNELTAENISVSAGFEEENLKQFFNGEKLETSLVITTAAHGGFTNKQAQYAKSMGITVLSYGEAVAEFFNGIILERQDIIGISVAGAHGKTTISALLATCLEKARLDPSYIVGTGALFPLGQAGHSGAGNYFVAEADEYPADPATNPTPKFLYQRPTYAIINNIDFDHPDVFSSLGDVELAFESFVKNIRQNGVLVINRVSVSCQKLLQNLQRRDLKVITYGDAESDYCITKQEQKELKTSFLVQHFGKDLGEFTLSIPGKHNAQNALAAIAVLVALGISIYDIKKVLPEYRGCKRRIEVVGKTEKGALVIDDYAHHPAEIQATLATLKGSFPQKKIVCIFQPHTYSRTKALISEFLHAFSDASTLLLVPTFASMREQQKPSIEFDEIFFKKFEAIHPDVHFFKSMEDVVEYTTYSIDGPDSVIVTMGAGDVYKISEKLKVKS